MGGALSMPKARKPGAIECTELMVGKHAFSDVGSRIKTLQLQRYESLVSKGWQLRSSCMSIGGKDSVKDKINQDKGVIQDETEDNPISIFSVFDGHGEFGHDASRLVSDALVPKLHESLHLHWSGLAQSKNALEAVFNDFRLVDTALCRDKLFEFSGSTGTVCCLMGQALLCAWLGDSRAVLGSLASSGQGSRSTLLSSDHKPGRADEKARVQKVGGEVRQAGFMDSYGGPLRVFKKGEQYPGLAVSRAFGDMSGKAAGVSSIPELTMIKLSTNDRCIIICSDGVWDEVTAEESVKIVMQYWDDLDPDAASRALCDEARRRWTNATRDGLGNIDDITAVVVMLKPPHGAQDTTHSM